MTEAMTDSEPLRRLVDELAADGWATPQWRPSFLAVARQQFIPDTIWRQDKSLPGPDLVPVRRDEDPDQWLRLASGDDALVTQVDDGHPAGHGGVGDLATSSASMPKVVALMLKYLDVHDGDRVLEIGTGTGYNAALLAHRLGPDHVTTIEIDPEVAAHARTALSDVGYGGVTTVTGDGGRGYPPHAPYERVIATVACPQVPYAWVEQTRPGGRIVTPWALDYYGFLVALTVADDGTATGDIVDHVSFMLLRDPRIDRRRRTYRSTANEEEQAGISETSVDLAEVANGSHALGGIVAIATRVPDCRMGYFPPHPEGDDPTLWLADHRSGSWARVRHRCDHHGPYPVHQYGRRRLWDEVEVAHGWWVEQGRPGADRWRLTVTPEGQRIELV